MPNSHARRTRQDGLVCVVSGGVLKIVWQSLNSQPTAHPRRVTFSEAI